MAIFQDQLKTRFAALGVIVVAVLTVLAVRLWTIQVLYAESFATQAENNRVREISLEAPRGRILDREGRPLVTNRGALAVLAAPSVRHDEKVMASLSALLDMPIDDIEEKLSSEKLEPLAPRPVALDVAPSIVAYLAEHESQFPGVEVASVPVREYPRGTLAAHVLGYIGEISEEQLSAEDLTGYKLGDLVGKTGVERQFESVLQGDKGHRRLEVDAKGRPRRVLSEVEAVAGRDVVLTLDIDVQRGAEKALADALKAAQREDFDNARAGAVVVLDVASGEVIAMASAPTYDPRTFVGGISQKEWKKLNAKGSEYPLTNRAVMSAYPPASTFKVVTGLAGLQTGITREWRQYYCPGKWTEMGEKWPKWCWERSGHGTVSFHGGIQYSCDTVFYEIGYEFYKRDKEELQAFARSMGLGSPTGVDLPGEVGGRVPDADWKRKFNENYPEYRTWLPGDTVNIAIGQGDLLVTPLQLAAVYGGLANGGKVMQPHVLRSVLDPDGTAVIEGTSTVRYAPKISAADLAVMRRALLSATHDGTAKGAFRGFDLSVAGKTGTAQVYGKDDYAMFAAYAPANKPKYAVVVVVEQGGSGGAIAAPAARMVLGALFGKNTEFVSARDESR